MYNIRIEYVLPASMPKLVTLSKRIFIQLPSKDFVNRANEEMDGTKSKISPGEQGTISLHNYSQKSKDRKCL